jgi:ribonucleoside-diphosphate reductase alpha chain
MVATPAQEMKDRILMRINRNFTVEGMDPFASIKFVPRTSKIVNPDGKSVFEMKDVMVPEKWSQVATDILAQKYFRKAGLPRNASKVHEEGVPELYYTSPQSGVLLPLEIGGKIVSFKFA